MRYKVLIILLAAYVFLNLIMPKIAGGLTFYLLTITCWLFVAFLTLKIHRKEENANLFGWRRNKLLMLNAAMIAVFQIVISILVGVLTAFGRSPYASTPTGITINIAYFSSTLFGMELSRAYLMKTCPKRKIIVGLGLTALLYTLIATSITRLTSLGPPAEIAKLFGSEFLPTLAASLLATYLALLGGPTASIAYLGTLQAFEWLSPILPNPAWPIKALINTLTPTIGFITISQTIKPFKLMQLGILSREDVIRTPRTVKKSSLTWTAIAIIATILLWGSTGLLGFQPNIIASGSMRPTLEVGDIAITVQTSPNNIKVGDIIQYWRQGEPGPTIHRVVEVDRSGGTTYIMTKGDANNAPDDPISPNTTKHQTVDKLILTIPKLGWISVHIKSLIGAIWSFFSANTQLAYATLTITVFMTSIYMIHAYKSRSTRRLRSLHRRTGWLRR